MSNEVDLTRVPPPVLLANFANYSKKKIQVYKIDDGDTHRDIHAVNCDGTGGTAFVLPHIWNFYLSTSGIEFTKKPTESRCLALR